jgi:chitinase domain-containing protein 1
VVEEAALDGVMIMTYDYGTSNGGPHSPLEWQIGCGSSFQSLPADADLQMMQQQLQLGQIRAPQADKIFLGIPFYGCDYVDMKFTKNLIKADYLDILTKYKTTFTWNAQANEHVMKWNDQDGKEHTTYYPSLVSTYLRGANFANKGYNMAIWELGQGLDYFMDVI